MAANILRALVEIPPALHTINQLRLISQHFTRIVLFHVSPPVSPCCFRRPSPRPRPQFHYHRALHPIRLGCSVKKGPRVLNRLDNGRLSSYRPATKKPQFIVNHLIQYVYRRQQSLIFVITTIMADRGRLTHSLVSSSCTMMLRSLLCQPKLCRPNLPLGVCPQRDIPFASPRGSWKHLPST